MHTRVVVVGGGLAGLVAAADLARAGLAPVLLEAAPRLGGRARTQVRDGYCFNQGPHALYVAGALNTALGEFGVEVSGAAPDLAKGLALWGDAVHPWPISLSRGELSPPLDHAESVMLAAELRRIARGDYDGRGQPLRAVTSAWPTRVQAVVEALVRLTSYTHAPALLDAKAAFDQLRLSFAGVLYVHGGWGRLAEGLAAAARTAGAELRTETRVSGLAPADGGWRVDILGAAPLYCDAAILAVPPSEAVALAPSSKALRAAASGLRAARAMGLDLGLSPGVRPRADFALGMNAPTYFSVHSAAARLAPEGGALAHLARYLAPEEAASAEAIVELEGLADSLLPGWRSLETRRQRQVGLTVSYAIPQWQDGGRRADGRLADSPGLHLAGDWIGEHGMLADAAAASARRAAAQIMTYLAGPSPTRNGAERQGERIGRAR